MNRKLASIQKIKDIIPADNSDNLEIAIVNNWRSVIRKNDFEIGEYVVFIETGAYLPIHEIYSFLGDSSYKRIVYSDGTFVEGYRINTVKLRSNISQGLILSINVANQYIKEHTNNEYDLKYFSEGSNVTTLLNIRLYENVLPIPKDIENQAIGAFPVSIVPKTGCERLQNVKLSDIVYEPYIITEKVNGSSMTFFHLPNDNFRYCTKNWELKPNPSEKDQTFYWKVLQEYKIPELMKPSQYVVQCEVFGKGSQNDPFDTPLSLQVFSIYDTETKQYVPFYQLTHVLDKIGLMHVSTVPIVQRLMIIESEAQIDYLFDLADSVYSNNCPTKLCKPEGFVLHSYNQTAPIPAFKVISKEYEVNNDEK